MKGFMGGFVNKKLEKIGEELSENEKERDAFVVTMYRYGDHDKHSYVLGVWSSEFMAKFYGEHEEAWRGNKYVAEIMKFVIDGNEEKY